MNTFKRATIQETINKALIVRGECRRFVAELIILAICYSSDEDTPMCMPDICYHVCCKDCSPQFNNKYILNKYSSLIENVQFVV